MQAISLGLLLLAPLVTGDVEAKKSPEAALGRQIAGFELHDYLGAVHRLDQWSDKKAIVVVFLGTECPVAGWPVRGWPNWRTAIATREWLSSASIPTRKIRWPTSPTMRTNTRSSFRS